MDGIVLKDLSKAYDCIAHDVMIANLEVYGPDIDSLKFVYTSLMVCGQKLNVNHRNINDGGLLGRGIVSGSPLREWLSV